VRNASAGAFIHPLTLPKLAHDVLVALKATDDVAALRALRQVCFHVRRCGLR
jgi:hypothetical protein